MSKSAHRRSHICLVMCALFVLWFLAVATIHHVRPGFQWTFGRLAVTLLALTAVKEVQEWALHVGRVFDGFSSLDAIGGFWRWLTGGR